MWPRSLAICVNKCAEDLPNANGNGWNRNRVFCASPSIERTHNNIHHYSSFTAAKVIFFGFSLNAYVCLPAHSHSSPVAFAPARTSNTALRSVPFLLLLLNSRPTFVYRCVIPTLAVSFPFGRCRYAP